MAFCRLESQLVTVNLLAPYRKTDFLEAVTASQAFSSKCLLAMDLKKLDKLSHAQRSVRRLAN